jgi:hypothetical protein
MSDAMCTSCGGALVSRRVYRMSPILVAVGYGGLLMSAIAIIGSLIMIRVGIDRLRVVFVQEMAAPQIEIVRVAGVPEAVIRKIAGAEAITAAERGALTDRQVRLVAEAQQHLAAARAAAASAAETARRNCIVVAVFGAVTGLLSGLLLGRRGIRQCARCGPAAPAAVKG